ncbi:hypothetical protein [Hyalangium gracile]|uniref:hypothetical protein n=1 Tax=Hyalangium gracile TaxID=394092 RepID=UPI001CCA5E3A|nr:hypothetical protein [Hyalangium gracile]
MTKRLIGLFASVALMGSGVAFANNDPSKKQDAQQTQSQGATGGSGSQVGQSGMNTQLSGNQLSGRVVKANKKTVWLEHAGAIVPLKIDKNTQFADPSLKQAQDIKEGDQIRASFEVRETENVATSIQKSTDAGMGGSGTEVMSPDSSINQSPGTLPSNDGTGGSGLEPDMGSGSDVNDSTGGSGIGSDSDIQGGSDLGTGSDVNNSNKPSGDF